MVDRRPRAAPRRRARDAGRLSARGEREPEAHWADYRCRAGTNLDWADALLVPQVGEWRQPVYAGGRADRGEARALRSRAVGDGAHQRGKSAHRVYGDHASIRRVCPRQ